MSIIIPMALMALLTLCYLPVVFFTRVRAMKSGEVSFSYFTTYQGDPGSDSVIKTTRHWANLFEAPVLFYAACLTVAVSHIDSALFVGLGYAYVATRLAHMLIHTGHNKVVHRIWAFFASNLVLAIIWMKIVVAVTAG
ncbi:MAG: MAPEG family protein [Sphingomonadales bacterium]